MASLANLLKAKAAPIGTPGLSHFDRILGRQLFGAGYTKTVSGALVHVTDAIAGPAIGAVLSIQFTQSGSGDPSPDNVRPITGWDGATLTRTGKNLCDPSNFYSGVTEEDGVYTFNTAGYTADLYTGQNGGSHVISEANRERLPRLKAGSYVWSNTYITPSAVNYVYMVDDSTGAITSTGSAQQQGYFIYNPFTLSAESLITICRSGNSRPSTFKEPQIEVGETATTYAPYTGTTYPITWQDVAGTVYGGTLDLIAGTLTVTREIVDLGNQSWSLVSGSASVFRTTLNNKIASPGGVNIACSEYRAIAAETPTTDMVDYDCKENANANYRTFVYIKNTAFGSDPDAARAGLAGVKLVYELATPQTYQLTGTTPELLAGVNNLWADAGDLALTYTGTKKE